MPSGSRVHLTIPSPMMALSFCRSHRLWLLAATGGCAMLAALAHLLRRKRAPSAAVLPRGQLQTPQRSWRTSHHRAHAASVADISARGDFSTRFGRRRRSFSNMSTVSAASQLTELIGGAGGGGVTLAPQQLGMLGVEALETVVGYWEDALAAYTSAAASSQLPHSLAVPSVEEADFCHQLQRIVDAAHRLQADCEQMFLFYESALHRSSTGSTPAPPGSVAASTTLGRTWTAISDSSLDSFHSAEGVADLGDFDDLNEQLQEASCGGLPLYQTALQLYETDGIPFRKLRTVSVGVGSDVEYLAKLHCLRLAYQLMMQRMEHRIWMADIGRQLLGDLMLRAGRPTEDIIAAFDDMVTFLSSADVWDQVKVELQPRNVKCFTFFDLVLDYIVLDAFDDLESPPATVVAVMQNRWLTNGFKESALNTAIWSVMKAKRQTLKYADGFKSRFYSLAEQMIPVLAWGLLGPDQEFGDLCHFLKDHVGAYVRDIFDCERARYTTVEDLADDLVKLTRTRYAMVCERFWEVGKDAVC